MKPRTPNPKPHIANLDSFRFRESLLRASGARARLARETGSRPWPLRRVQGRRRRQALTRSVNLAGGNGAKSPEAADVGRTAVWVSAG